jgi:hypothetical protein
MDDNEVEGEYKEQEEGRMEEGRRGRGRNTVLRRVTTFR